MVDAGISRSDGPDQAPPTDLELKPEPENAAPLQEIVRHLRNGGRLWLFLDYDGTLVPYAPTPDEAVPDPALIQLLEHLVSRPNIRTVILSGRSLSSLQKMLQMPGLVLAGLYGVEIQMPGSPVTRRAPEETVRKLVEQIKTAWTKLIDGRPGFLLEDKGLSVALHSRLADPADAQVVVPKAQAILVDQAVGEYRILGGDRFLEIVPLAADKGKTVGWFLQHDPFPDALTVYFGDDDKDEEAFAVVRELAGIPIIVGPRQPETLALARLATPEQARAWLQTILEAAR